MDAGGGGAGARPRRWFVAVAALVLILAWAGGDAEPTVAGGGGTPSHGGTAVVGLVYEPATLNPYQVQGGFSTFMVMRAVLDQWIDIDPQGRLVPQVATRVPSVANGGIRYPPDGGMDLRFAIHPQAAWSDGKPITCADMRFTWKTMVDDRWLILTRNGWEKIRDVSCPTPKRVVVRFSEPYAPWPNILRLPPLPAHALGRADFNRAWSHAVPIGSGPFLVKEWKQGVHLKLVRNPRFWRAGAERAPYLDGIEFRFFKTENAINLQMSSGELHMVNRGLENTLESEHQLFPNARIIVSPGTGARVIGFNTRRIPDRRVRQAIAHAIDRREIASLLMGRPFTPMQSTLGTQQQDLRLPAWERYRRDPARVRALLEEAGYQREGRWWTRDGKPLTIRFKSYAEKTYIRRIAQVVQQQLAREGIKLELTLEPISVLYGQSMPKAAYDMGMWGIGLGYDPEQRGYFACPEETSRNAYRWCDRKATDLFERSNLARTRAARRPIVHAIQRRMAQEVPVLPVVQDFDEVIHARNLHGVVPNSQGLFAWNAAEWWLS